MAAKVVVCAILIILVVKSILILKILNITENFI